MKIFLVRHGLTITNKEKIFSPDEAELSPEAYPALDALKERLSLLEFRRSYVSPLKRTIQTAECLGLKDMITDDRLKEYNFGIFKGLSFAEAEKKYPFEVKTWMKNPAEAVPPGGESGVHHFMRISSFLNEICTNKEDCLIVTHYGSIAMALAWALDDFFQWNKFAPTNASISVLEIKRGVKLIDSFNIV